MPLFKRKPGQILNSWLPRLKASYDSSDRKSGETSPAVDQTTSPKPSQISSVDRLLTPNGDLGEGSLSLDATVASGSGRPRSLLLNADFMQELDGDMGISGRPLDSPMRTSSRLSKTLLEILHDKEALPYFIQYMESRNAGRYVRFWLDAKSFQTAAWTRIRTHSLNALAKSSLAEISRNGTVTPVSSSPPHPRPLSSSFSTVTSLPAVTAPSLSQASEGISLSSSHGRANGSPQQKDVAENYVRDSWQPAVSTFVRPAVPSSFPAALSCAHPQISPSSTSSSLSSPCYASPCAPDPGLLAEVVTDDTTIDAQTSDENVNTNLPLTYTTPEDDVPLSSGEIVMDDQNKTCSAVETCSPGEQWTTSLPAAVVASSKVKEESSGNGSEFGSSQTTPGSGTGGQSEFGTNKMNMGQKLLSSIEKDAVSIYTKYISFDASHPIGISDELRNETTSKICQEDGKVDPQCFVDCQQYVLELMEKDYYPDFLHSVFHCKHQINVLTSGKVYLADILHNDTAIFYFMEFMEQEDAINLFQFWMAAENFQQHLSLSHGCYDGLQAQEDAMVLYDKYFSLQATQPLGFDDKIRLEVESNICREGGPLPDCFAKPKNMVLRVIEKVYFPNFLRGDLYYKFLSELINTVQLANDLPQKSRKRLGSDASSENSAGSQSTGAESVSSRNTLLATDTSHLKKALNKMQVDLRIDSVLLNPDALWKRNAPGKMSFGHINDLGQFVSEYDPEPELEKKKSSMFFRKKKDREKEQEDMAVQIAQMIISDVTSITQANQNPSHQNLQSAYEAT